MNVSKEEAYAQAALVKESLLSVETALKDGDFQLAVMRMHTHHQHLERASQLLVLLYEGPEGNASQFSGGEPKRPPT